MKSDYNHLSPTVSVFPHTTVGNVRIPLNAFRHPDGLRTRASLYDTPGIEGDSAYLNGFIDDEYTRAVSLLKVGGFQRPPDRLTPGFPMSIFQANVRPFNDTWRDDQIGFARMHRPSKYPRQPTH